MGRLSSPLLDGTCHGSNGLLKEVNDEIFRLIERVKNGLNPDDFTDHETVLS